MKWRNGIGITFDTHLHLYVYNVVWSYNWHIASLLYEKTWGFGLVQCFVVQSSRFLVKNSTASRLNLTSFN